MCWCRSYKQVFYILFLVSIIGFLAAQKLISRFKHDGMPTVQQAGSHSVLLSSKKSPAGVQFNFKLNPEKNYRLLVSGQYVSGVTFLRIRKDEQVVWSNAPNKKSNMLFIVSNTRHLELLFYGEKTFSYRLNSLGIHKILNSKTDDDLKKEILNDNPGLQALAKKNKQEAALVLLDWAANHLVFALDSESHQDTSLLSASAIYYQLFNKKIGGVYCGGAADFLMKICHLFNINAFNVDMGVLNTELTHVTTIVPVYQKGKYDYYLFDPTFNAVLKDKKTQRLVSLNKILGSSDLYRSVDVALGGISHRRALMVEQKSGVHQFKNDVFQCNSQFYKRYIEINRAKFNEYNIISDDYLLIRLLSNHFIALRGIYTIEQENHFMKITSPKKLKINRLLY